jgi:hypothetical protein
MPRPWIPHEQIALVVTMPTNGAGECLAGGRRARHLGHRVSLCHRMAAPAAAAMSTGGTAVRSALRRLLRAQKKAFANDAPMQATAVAAIREQFAAGAGVTDGSEAARLIGEAREAAEFLETNVVQNTLNEDGHYVPGPGGVRF